MYFKAHGCLAAYMNTLRRNPDTVYITHAEYATANLVMSIRRYEYLTTTLGPKGRRPSARMYETSASRDEPI